MNDKHFVAYERLLHREPGTIFILLLIRYHDTQKIQPLGGRESRMVSRFHASSVIEFLIEKCPVKPQSPLVVHSDMDACLTELSCTLKKEVSSLSACDNWR